MIDKKDFEGIIERIEGFDSKREQLIKECRELLKNSKRLIYSVHRENEAETKEVLSETKKSKDRVDALLKKDSSLAFEGSYSEAMQEYVEAMCYYNFVENGKIPKVKELGVKDDDYLAGICDLTGELERRAVLRSITNNFEDVKRIRAFVDEMHGIFLKMNLRNGNVRKKYDSIKWNLKKIEEVLYDINMKR